MLLKLLSEKTDWFNDMFNIKERENEFCYQNRKIVTVMHLNHSMSNTN